MFLVVEGGIVGRLIPRGPLGGFAILLGEVQVAEELALAQALPEEPIRLAGAPRPCQCCPKLFRGEVLPFQQAAHAAHGNANRAWGCGHEVQQGMGSCLLTLLPGSPCHLGGGKRAQGARTNGLRPSIPFSLGGGNHPPQPSYEGPSSLREAPGVGGAGGGGGGCRTGIQTGKA